MKQRCPLIAQIHCTTCEFNKEGRCVYYEEMPLPEVGKTVEEVEVKFREVLDCYLGRGEPLSPFCIGCPYDGDICSELSYLQDIVELPDDSLD